MSNSLKMLLVVYNISIEAEVQAVLKQNNVSCFTQWPRLVGKGVSTGPKMDNDVWPGANGALFVVTTEDQARQVMAGIKEIRDEVGQFEGVKAFLLNVEEMLGDI